MRSEFVYTVEEIFGRVLDEVEHKKYYIGPYQRGYKWDSRSPYDQVPQLLTDVYQARQKSLQQPDGDDKEYFLQYITVLKNDGRYEVIDGQQRLTTLAILLHCLDDPSVARDKLEYARDEGGNSLLEKIEYEGEPRSQDEDYIIGARECVDRFTAILENLDELNEYKRYLLNNVKIILNRENDFVKPEDVFVNLNGNKIELTNAYLVKGLFLTRSVKRTGPNGMTYSYFNIQEQRKINGRMWDEIQNWIQQPAVAHYFFGKDGIKDSMDRLLEMILPPKDKDENTTGTDAISAFKATFDSSESENFKENYRLFNRYNEVVKTDADGLKWMGRLVHAYKKLRSVYESNETYNLLGYVLFLSQNTERTGLLAELMKLSDSDIQHNLAPKALRRLPDLSAGDIDYPDKNLTPLLLAFSVFPDGFDSQRPPRFDFPAYDSASWTLEHISPQNPKDQLTVEEQWREEIFECFRRAKLEEMARDPEFDKSELGKIPIEDGVLTDTRYVYEDVANVHAMGNMALLNNGANSAASNNPYFIKRGILMQKQSQGAFIPFHTLAVLNKSFIVGDNAPRFSPQLTTWNQADVDAHAEWMRRRNKQIRELLNQKLS